MAPATEGEEQLFKFVNPRPLPESLRKHLGGATAVYNIMVGREGKYVGASWAGDFVRWDRDPNDGGQDFVLVPIEAKPMPDLGLRVLRDPEARVAPPAVFSLTDELPGVEWSESSSQQGRAS